MDTIQSKRLILKQPTFDNVAHFFEWHVPDDDADLHLSIEILTREEIRKRIQTNYYWSATNRYYIIYLRSTNKPIGFIHYWYNATESHLCNIGIRIADRNERNRGLGTEAQSALIDVLFAHTSVRAIEMYTDVDNRPQQSCLAKLRFDFIEAVQFHDLDKCRVGRRYRLHKTAWLKHHGVTQ